MRRVEEQNNKSNILPTSQRKKKKKANREKSNQKNIEIESSGIKCSQASELGRIALRRNI